MNLLNSKAAKRGQNKISTIRMHQQERIIKKIETIEVIVALRDDGIVHVFFKDFIEFDIRLQLELIDICTEICENKFYPFIYESAENVTITKEARDNALSLEGKSPILFSAILVQTFAHKLIVDFYLKFNTPKLPTKAFKHFQEGINWLKEMNKA